MKKGILVLFAALFAGVAAFFAMRWHMAEEHHHGSRTMLDAMPELEWLKRDLHLTDDQFSKVSDLHALYRPKCAEMCRRIEEAHKQMDDLALSTKGMTPELQAALKAHADLHLECQEAMLQHLYRTAAALNQAQAQQYLKSMLPFALDFSHSEPTTRHDH